MEYSVGDLVIRIKNGYMAGKESIRMPYSKLKEQILKKLIELRYIKNFKVEGDKKKSLLIDLLYTDSVPALSNVKIFSKPGRRWYTEAKKIKPVLSGFGVAILSTSKGILTNTEAKKERIGGELLFYLW